MDIKYRVGYACEKCGQVHITLDETNNCCLKDCIECFECGKCGKLHRGKLSAMECCVIDPEVKGVPNPTRYVLCDKCGNIFLSSAGQYTTTRKNGKCPMCREDIG